MFTLNKDQETILIKAQQGRNLFITGSGGVGKSVLLEQIVESIPNTVVVAPTGVAAKNVSGATVHSVFRLPLRYISNPRSCKIDNSVIDLFSDDAVKTIVLEEASMLRADVFTAIDWMLRRVKRRKKKPFGGIQVICVGDFYQLESVVVNHEKQYFGEGKDFESSFCFDTVSWKEAGFEICELTQVMRQTDEDFIGKLNCIRKKADGWKKALYDLNVHALDNDVDETKATFLCSTNKAADTVNRAEYRKIKSAERTYNATSTGKFSGSPVDSDLSLKVGTRVMIVRNAVDLSYYNGSTGVVKEMTNNTIFIRLDSGQEVSVGKVKWEEIEYKNNDGEVSESVIGTFTQFPIRLGYAVTIHKSQGLSLSSAIISTGRGCFAHGQAYVALSRLRSLEGLCFMDPIEPREIIVNERVKMFYNGDLNDSLFSGV